MGSNPTPGTRVKRQTWFLTLYLSMYLTCTKCNEKKVVEKFSWKNKKEQKRQSQCKDCVGARNKKHYEANKRLYKERALHNNKKYLERNRDFINQLKAQTPCADCGRSFHPIAMDFDHLSDKSRNISEMVILKMSLSSLKEEIAKCEIVCACCHRVRTYNRQNS